MTRYCRVCATSGINVAESETWPSVSVLATDISISVLGITLEKNLSMDNHISSVSKSVRCIDYAIANSVLYRITKKYISKLHKAQNLLPCVVTGCLQPGLYTVLQQLHWLPIEYHIKFKIASITFHTLHHFSQPACLYSAVHAHHSTCSLGLSDTNLLSVPFVCTTFDARSFSVGAPKVCNSLPAALQMCTSPDTSCHDLKTHY